MITDGSGSKQLHLQIEEALNRIGQQFAPNFKITNIARFGEQRKSSMTCLRSNLPKNNYIDGCVSEPTSFSNSLEWSETDLGQTANISCPCGNVSLGVGHPVALRLCNGSFTSGAQWATAHDSVCNFTSSAKQLCNVRLWIQLVISNCYTSLSLLEYQWITVNSMGNDALQIPGKQLN